MRQVPLKNKQYSYLIVGNGKLSKHFRHYFNLKNISYLIWTRKSKESFESISKHVARILVLIKDDEIQKFISTNQDKVTKDKIWIHCSGMLSTPLADSSHPLMTFTDELYDLVIYENISFITEKGRKNFKELFPDLANPHYEIESDKKILYHAYCVLSGNFTTIMWQFFFDFLEKNNIPKTAAYPYLSATTENLINLTTPLTGPIQRNDINVISEHLKSLNNLPLKNVYESLLIAYSKWNKEHTIENN